MRKEKRYVIARHYCDGELTNTRQVMLTVHTRKDGSQYVNYCMNKRPLIDGVVTCEAQSFRALTIADILGTPRG